MPAQFWEAVLNSPGLGAGANYTNTTTINDVSPAPQLVLPANFLYTGQSLRFTAFGTVATSATTPTLVLGFYFGGVAGVALAASAALTVPNTATVNWPWRMEATATIRSVGATGTIITQGFIDIAATLTTLTHAPLPATALNTVTIDTSSVAKAVTVGATWGTAASTNILVCHQFLVEAMN